MIGPVDRIARAKNSPPRKERNLKPTPSTAVLLWSAGFATAAITQSISPGRFGSGTAWGPNHGWQREIAIWNLGLLTIVWRARQPDADIDRALVTGFSVLSSLFAINHLAAATKSPRSWAHWLAATGNVIGLAIGAASTPRHTPAPTA